MKLRTRILLDARDLIADKQFWTTGTMNTETDPPPILPHRRDL